MAHIGIITGSTRPGRKSLEVAQWVHEIALARKDNHIFEIVDIKDFNLPLWEEPVTPSEQEEKPEYAQVWSDAISKLDGFVFVTPEYNHAAPAVLLNALTFLYEEWGHKAAGFVSYGSTGGVRSVENLRLTLAEFYVATTRTAPALSTYDDWVDQKKFKPRSDVYAPIVNTVLSEVVSWSEALKPVRLAEQAK